MTASPLDRDFARYRDSGDPDALARVFDAAAPRLLLVATQLAPRDAEDLLQSTFVRAIQRAAAWDPERPLWPWLTGILAHEARNLHRRQARQPDPERLRDTTSPSPEELASRNETVASIARAVDRLPEPFAQVVALRLVHDLEPVQIARVLGVPAETVRSRLHRGLARLRLVLPAGVAGLSALAATRPALAAIRDRVLAESVRARPYLPPTATTTAPVLGITMTKKLVAVVVLAATAWFAWPLLRASEDAATRPDAVAQADCAGAAASSDGRTAGQPDRQVAVAEQVERHVVGPGAGWWLDGTVRTDADGDGPVPAHSAAGATVEAFVSRGQLEESLGTTSTDDDGSYRIALHPILKLSAIQRHTARVRVVASLAGQRIGHAPATPEDLDPGTPLRADLILEPERGVAIGRVLDADGRPVAAAHVLLRWANPNGGLFSAVDHDSATDVDGTFRIDFDHDGEHSLSVGSATAGQAWVPPLDLSADGTHDFGDVVLQRDGGELAFRLVMCDGTPAGGLDFDVRAVEERQLALIHTPAVSTGPGKGPRAVLGQPAPIPTVSDGVLERITHFSSTTLPDGTFRTFRMQAGRYLVRVRDRFRGEQEFEVETGAMQHELELAGQLLTVQIHERGSGPLPGAQLSAHAYPSPEAADDQESRTDLMSAVTLDDCAAACTFLAPWNSAWVFHCGLDGAMPVAVQHVAEPGIGHATVVLELEPLVRIGNIQFEFLPRGAAPPATTTARLRFAGMDAYAIADYTFDPRMTRTWSVPAGDWQLELQPGEALFGQHCIRAITERVQVRHGETTRVRVPIERLGLVAVRLTGTPPESGVWRDVRATLDDGSGPREEAGFVLVEDPPEKVSERDGELRPAILSTTWQGVPYRTLRPDTLTVLRLPVRPGNVALALCAKDYATVFRTVQVRAGEVTVVEIPMQRE